MTDLFNLRREFKLNTLDEADILENPHKLFKAWVEEALASNSLEPSSMCLSTADEEGKPSSRIVLLKQIRDDGLVFFTNYNSKKGLQISRNGYCAANFVWHELQRQILIEGTVEKISAEDSDAYFKQRPEGSKIAVWASPQSQSIPNRAYLEELVSIRTEDYRGKEIPRPDNWGGYIIKPQMVEFWQGRENRLHDRLRYSLASNGSWEINRIAP